MRLLPGNTGFVQRLFLAGDLEILGKQTLNNLALLYLYQGRYSEAEPLYERSLSIFEKVLPANHPTLAIGRGNLEQLRSQLDSGA